MPVSAWPAACFLAGAARLIDTGLRTFAAPRARRDRGTAQYLAQLGRRMTGLLSRCCPACYGHTKAIAGSGFDLGIYGCAARDSNPEPAD